MKNIAFLDENNVVYFLAKNTTLEKIKEQHGDEKNYIETEENIRCGMSYVDGKFIAAVPIVVDPQVKINEDAHDLLDSTDYRIIKAAEELLGNVPELTDLIAERQAARNEIM